MKKKIDKIREHEEQIKKDIIEKDKELIMHIEDVYNTFVEIRKGERRYLWK